MEQIIVNKDCIQEKEITEIVKRVKAIIINSKNEILLGYSHNDYQFLGGDVENGDLHGIANEMLEVIKIYKNKFLK